MYHTGFSNIALYHGGRDGVVPAAANVGRINLVFGGNGSDMFGKGSFCHGFRQLERFLQAYVGRDGLVNQFVQAFDADFLQHSRQVLFLDADMPAC